MGDLLGIVGSVVGVLGLVAAYVFYILAKKEREPAWSIKTNNLIQDSVARLDGLRISYNDTPVSNLSVSKIAFWNAGRESLLDNVLLPDTDRPHLIATEGTVILHAEVLKTNNPNNSVVLNGDSGTDISIKFHYLNSGDGAVLQVIHTGTSSESIRIEGRLIDAKRILRRDLPMSRPQGAWPVLWRYVLLPSLLISLLVLGVIIRNTAIVPLPTSFNLSDYKPDHWWPTTVQQTRDSLLGFSLFGTVIYGLATRRFWLSMIRNDVHVQGLSVNDG